MIFVEQEKGWQVRKLLVTDSKLGNSGRNYFVDDIVTFSRLFSKIYEQSCCLVILMRKLCIAYAENDSESTFDAYLQVYQVLIV